MTPAAHPDTPAADAAPVTSARSRWAFAGLVAAATAAAALSMSVWAEGASAPPDAPAMPPPQAMQGHGMHEGHGGPLAEMDLFAGPGLSRLLDGAQATDAQRAQIRQIAQQARTDLQALRAQGEGLREQALTLWAQPRLDPAAAEKLRQQMAAHHEQFSRRMSQAMLDVGQVLTPAQRATVVEGLRRQHAGWRERMKSHFGAHGKGSAGTTAPDGTPASPGMSGHAPALEK